jgi:peptidoglycan/xylan/chitin deacetylase (PgdA/CDA1 family)
MFKGMQRLWGEQFPNMHPMLQQQFPQALWMGNRERWEIALTFDDGPRSHDTPQLLEVLARHHIKATFFFLGERIQTMRQVVRKVAAAGHQVAIHGYRHRPFPLEHSHDLEQQLERTRMMIADMCGCDPLEICDVRPPFGVFTPNTLRLLQRWHYRPVMWSVVPLHWTQSARRSIEQVMQQTRRGAIIVLHEGQPDSPPVAELTDRIVGKLRATGFTFVTIEHMWQVRDE